MTSKSDAPEDPVLEERIEHAIAPYRGRLTAEALEEARRLLTVALTTHPVLAPLMDQLREEAATGASGVMPKKDDEQTELSAADGSRKRGR